MLLALYRRQQYICLLSKALLHFGAPAHRIEDHLLSAQKALGVVGSYRQRPDMIIASFVTDSHTIDDFYIRAKGHISLSALHRVHLLSRKVRHGKRTAQDGINGLKNLMAAVPRYPWYLRIFFAFVCSACIAPLEFGGSCVDMLLAGALSSVLKAITIRSHELVQLE
jgi:uncharacterized membrane protein YjjP (DUF1212 family)